MHPWVISVRDMEQLARIILWLSILAWSLWLGGLMYETTVIMPIWSASLPESVLQWSSRSQRVNPTRFFVPVASGTVLFSVAALILGWKHTTRRFWLAMSAACGVAALGFTFVYFFPKNDILFRNLSAGLSGDEIAAIGRSWITGNWIRLAIMAVGFFSALRVLGSGSKPE
jgi:Domain of unknown function (DUF1772)